jgi:hypothetical protein
MYSLPSTRRFQPGNRVTVAYGPEKGKTGAIAEIVSAPVNMVYRYRVEFADNTSGVFFGFELELVTDSEAANR